MNNVDMIAVQSSNVAEVGYDEDNEIAYVRFLNGALYIYIKGFQSGILMD